MRKLKQILAGFLAMNLTISAASTGIINVKASEEYSGEGVYDEMYAEEGVQTYAEEAAAPEEVVSETEAAYYSSSSDIAMEAEVPEAPLETENSTPVPETPATPATTASVETPENTTVTQVPQESTSESISNQVPESSSMTSSLESSESEESSLTEQSTEDNSEEEEASSEEASSEEESTEEIAEFAARSTVNRQLKLSQFKKYNKDNSIEITSEKELILLSNCDPEELQDITINLNMTGNINLTKDQNVKSGDDISAWITNLSTTDTVSDSEEQQTDEQSEVVVQEESVTAEQEYSFQGIGSADYPFRGTITGSNIPWYIDRPFFDGLSSTAQLYSGTDKLQLQWYGDGTVPMLAEVYRMEEDNSENGSANSQPAVHTLNVSVSKGEGATAMGSLIDTVKAVKGCENDTLQIGDVVTYDGVVSVSTSEGNAGLICNTLESGKINLNGYVFPSVNYTVNSTATYDTINTSAAGDVGGVIGVMKTGTSLSIKSEVNVNAGSTLNSTGNAGGLVGLMEDGATIAVSDNVSVTLKNLQLTAGASAGGLVGLMQKGAKITTGNSAAVTLSSPSMVGTVSAGGIVGTAEDVIFADSDMLSTITVNLPTVTSNTTVGGFIGKYTLDASKLESTETSLSLPSQVKIETPTLIVQNNGVAGGYFGYLELKGNLSYTIASTSENAKKSISLTYSGCSAEAAGAIAGKVTSTDIASTLLIQNVSVSATNSNSTIQRHGGLIGELGTKANASDKAYLKVSTVEIKVTNPYATDEQKDTITKIDKGYGFGGIVGLLAQESILQTENTVTISTGNNTAINRGGGLVGYAEKSVINVSGTTDLSNTLYVKDSGKNSSDPKTGWLVGCQDSALIYANGDGNGNGWSYIRGKESGVTKQAMNDIGNYGQIIRLHSTDNSETERSNLSPDLIIIDATSHEVSYKRGTEPTVNESTITLGSTDAFARLSISWNTRGYFGDVTGIQQDVKPQSKNITLSEDIDLTGSGITGLSRDSYSTDDTYSGTFDGGNHTITLASGETFGFKSDKKTLAQAGDDGYGEVISAGAGYHGRQGIFAEMSTATVQNLTVDGNIWVSNNGSADMLVGGIAAELTADNSKINISEVVVKETITADGAGVGEKNGLMLGGFFGGSYNKGIQVSLNALNNSSVAAASISISDCPNEGTYDRRTIAGGVIGELGEQSITININQLTVQGSITTDAKKKAYIGGLIGAIKGEYANTDHLINILNLVFNDFTITAERATDMSGGLFGSVWASVEVTLQTPTDIDKYAVDVQKATINVQNAASVGGFAYRAGGKWEIQDRGINLNTFSISAKKDVGLLVCRGEQAKEQLSGGEKQIAALYLSTTKYWENSYKISENNVSVTISENGAFDEFVAYTTSTSWNSTLKAPVSDILKNDKNGIISIATQDVIEGNKTTRIGVDPSDTCTTYQNRTTYGKIKHNKWSRYYYDLDQCLIDINGDATHKNNGKIDTPQELLIWSVYTYADKTLEKYFYFDGCAKESGERLYIGNGADAKDNADLDMKKYSYYPVNYSVGSVYIQHANIKFHNQEIENIENSSSDRKSTQGQTAIDYTQHYTMHCGLLLSYQAVSKSGAPLYVNNVTLLGSIGKVNNETSGALVADFAGGYDSMYCAININNTKLDNLKVNGCDEGYAPLLINRISLNLNLTINTISTVNYDTKGTPVASSLIGTVGSTTAENITMNFQNIKLPDKKADSTTGGGIFSHATLLESYTYKKDSSTSNATYIFYYDDDWGEGEGRVHHDNVTYGKEITGSTEFANIQKWYYDENLHGTGTGLVYDFEDNKSGFDARGYLPYVCVSYNEENCTHEIKVNQRVENILEGCGTYSHPYRITKAAEMNILSEYLSTGSPQKDWRVRVTTNQENVHTSKNDADYTSTEDIVYQYDGNSKWVQVENKATDGKTEDWQSVSNGNNTLPKDFMLNYLLNAYYDIRGTAASEGGSAELVLNDFKGFGTERNPFRGVITSGNHTTLVLKGDRTGNGLIPYSYGSVVKNLKISYKKSDENQGKTLTYETNVVSEISETYPKVAFGGVIGCVMGGDNIIDGVMVQMEESYLTLSGDKSHLLQIGGYVGSISGGGVIFRNMTDDTGLTEGKVAGLKTDTSTETNATEENNALNLYVNPYVGRVLDGFAFYEKTSNEQGVLAALDNTNKNYKINTLNAGRHLDVNSNAITVNDAEGLLILSAIVNSGAASNGSSLAYSRIGESQDTVLSYQDTGRNVTYYFGGKYGKVRNAAYSTIGTKEADQKDSVAEDQKLPGEKNLPYLIQKYGNKQTAIFSAMTDSMINLDNNASGFDMTNYGNGYQGIGARYVSNAIRDDSTSSSTPVNNPENLVPEVKTFNGNSQTVTVAMQVSEYTDDDYPAASVGGIFNVVRVSSNGTLSNVIIRQNTNSTLTQEDVASSEETKTVAGISLTYYDSNGAKADTSCKNKKEVGLGGFAGSLVGYTADNANRDITVSGIQINNLTIESPASAGGIFGNVGKPAENKNSNIAILLQPQDSQMTYGVAFNNCSYQNLNVTGKYAAGGFAGYIGNTDQNPKSTINETFGTKTGENAVANTMENSTITATDNTSWAGGLFGYVKTRLFINMTDAGVKNDKSTVTLQNVAVSAGTAVGGCVGYIDTKRYGIYNVTVKGTNSSKVKISLNSTTTGTFYAGGIVGYAKGGWNDWHPDNWNYVGYIGGSSIKNVQINTLEMAGKHDYDNTGEIKTNYITGGIVGQTAGGQTRMEKCIVTTSDIYGSVASGITGQTDSQMEFVNCEVNGASENSKTNIKGFSTAGGILGFWTGGQSVTIQGCKIQYLEVEGKDWGSGAIIGDAKGDGAGILYLFDTSAQNSTVTAAGNKDNGGGRWPCVGSIIGNLRNSIKASNVLISDIELSAVKGIVNGRESSETHGLLFGNANSKSINIAGISIQEIPDSNKEWQLAGANNGTSNSYIAFADYSGTAKSTLSDQITQTTENAAESPIGSDLLGYKYTKDGTIKTDVASPYVVTSPKSALALYDIENDTSPKYLYGDGVAWTTQPTSSSGSSSSSSTGESSSSDSSAASGSDTSDSSTAEGGESSGSSSTGSASSTTTSFTVMAKQIWDNKTTVTNGHYAYKNISVTSFDFTSLIATYNANQTTKVKTDFPVIQLTNGNADVVTSYLDILTNGAFSAANKMNTVADTRVTARVDVYSYDSAKKKFIKAVDENGRDVTPAFRVNTNTSNNISFVTTSDYDNDRDRFNLLTVTFTEKDADGNAHHYNVFVPILVRRMLEMDFTATLTYGTDFNKENYSSLTNHVLESFGSSVTGYLTYTYNSDAGTYTDYGWQSYINAGGNVMEMKKSIRFTMSTPKKLPIETQLSLVDENGKVYYYTATGEEDNDNYGIVIPLASFQSSDGKLYQEPSISELIGATASDTGNKLFVEVDESGKIIDATDGEEAGKTYPEPTVRLKTDSGYKYYRLAQSGESAKYSITVNEDNLQKVVGEGTSTKKNISTVTENYYLVITVPENANSEALNGSIQTTIESEIPHQIHYLKRDDGKVDGHGSTASTYQLSNGYRQVLTETSNDDVLKKITTADSTMKVNVTDKITFPNSQSYDNRDQLYLRFVGGLQKTLKDAAGNTTTASEQFPKGTTGEVSFSVYTMDGDTKRYYEYTNGKWSQASTSEQSAVSYTWTSKDGEMELPLATEQPSAQETTSFISLQGLRDLIKPSSANNGDTTFYVEVNLVATLPTSGLDVIPETKVEDSQLPSEYTKLTCFAQLSTVSQSLTYSSNRATANMTTVYYRDEPAGVKLMYDADLIDQLGVNLLDLRYLDASKEHSLIDTTATYDLSAMKNLESTLKDSTGIKFTLTLCQKNENSNTEAYGSALLNADKYLAVELKSSNSDKVEYSNGTWSWTVPQGTYYDTEAKKLKDNTIFSNGRLTQLIQLKVNVNANILYSNYKVILTAEILNKNGTVSDSRKDDNIIYTFAKINPEFVEQNN